ncbi:MAG TPA: phenylalanine--tRNA ligase beta subunit-related protein [Blastocatellia bacterium]|jgi:DNA/RNA-binding domain of Phe-tRNA-synthetase-like protein|nr:phenylalanine--tRNA ligase beta subunit-related protein [Blastocatellia bacterium]
MIFEITDRIFTDYPEALVGVVIARDIDNAGEAPQIDRFLKEQEARVIDAMSRANMLEDPRISSWREAYRKFGAKPQKYYSSVESLVRRVVNGQKIPNINKLVDIYNGVSLKYIVPAGGEDLDRIRGDVALTIAGDGEAPILLIGERDERAPKRGEVIYRDEAGAICRRWNWREAERTKLTEGTRNAILVIEALKSEYRGAVEEATSEMADLIKAHCGGSARSAILDKTAPAIPLA